MTKTYAIVRNSVTESTVAKYMVRSKKPPSQTWRTFLNNHVGQIAAIDFFTVPTVTFRVLYVFLILRHDRRRVVHFNVTTSPTTQWTAQQVVEAFPFEEALRFLLRDRDGIYSEYVRDRVGHMGIEEVLIAPQAPWQNPYVERLIGSVRRECLDHMIVLNEENLFRILAEYLAYYHEARTPLSLERNSPTPRAVCPPERGKIVAKSYLGGLHHCYTQAAFRGRMKFSVGTGLHPSPTLSHSHPLSWTTSLHHHRRLLSWTTLHLNDGGGPVLAVW